jgi:predicted Zn-dependent protease with MMP-like domain
MTEAAGEPGKPRPATIGQIVQFTAGVACAIAALVSFLLGLALIGIIAAIAAAVLLMTIASETGSWDSSGKRWSMSDDEFDDLLVDVERQAAPAAQPVAGATVAESRDPHDPDDFEALIAEALDELPDFMQAELQRNVAVVISDDGAAEHAYGLYVGDTLARDDYADRILIYRDTLLRDFGDDREELRRQVTTTVRHELAHHLGADEHHVRDLGL